MSISRRQLLSITLTGLLSSLLGTAHADSTTILTTIPAAENAIQVSDGRLFVSGSDGLYLVDAASKTKSKIPVAFDATSAPSTANTCYFTGLTQYSNYLYAACTPDVNSDSSPRYLLMMDLNQSPQIRAFYRGNDAGFYNGIAVTGYDTLFVANMGGLNPYTSGKIQKVTMSAPGKVSSMNDWLYTANRINGMKVSGSTLYYTEDNLFFAGVNFVKKVPITSTGAAGMPTTIYYSTSYIDDFTLVSGGLVVAAATANPLNGAITGSLIHLSESGSVLHSAQFPDWQPTAAAILKSPTWGSLLVTELKHGNVFIFNQSWGLNPR
jgi:hypothetical protein